MKTGCSCQYYMPWWKNRSSSSRFKDYLWFPWAIGYLIIMSLESFGSMLCSFTPLPRSWEPSLWSTTNKCRKLYGVSDLFCDPASSSAGCFLLFNHLTSNSISPFPGFVFNFVLYYICLWIICDMFCLNKKSLLQDKNRDGRVEGECHLQRNFHKENLFTHWEKEKKISENSHR